ncbi:MAG: site-specific integrase [Butyricimonas faecihominis]
MKRYSENTIISYKADLYQFYEFCGLERSNEDFSRVTTKLVREWVVAKMRGDLRGNGARGKLSAASVKRRAV